jgi:PAS domain S-box-containing protein
LKAAVGDAQHIATIAAHLLRQFGRDAERIAAARAATCTADGDTEDALLWKRVARAIRGFQQERRPIGSAQRRGSRDRATILVDADIRLAFDAVPHAYLLLDRDLRIAGANNAYLTATMTRRDEILGYHVFDVFPDTPDLANAASAASLRRSMEQVLVSGQPDTMSVQRYDIQSRDGQFEERWWQATNLPAFGEDGRFLFIIHSVADVTSRMKGQSGVASVAREGDASV